MRRAARRDENEPAIRDALHAAGFWTIPVSDEGVPDLIVGKRGHRRICLMEIKMPGRKLKPAQVEFFRTAEGSAVFKVEDPTDAVHLATVEIVETA